MKTRHDAWTYENDEFLAHTVLKHIENGSTQTSAFEEVGHQLNRTSAACGYRWNAEVRHHYVENIELAKRKRKEKTRQAKKARGEIIFNGQKKDDGTMEQNSPLPSITIEDCIAFLSNLNAQQSQDEIKNENVQLQKEHEDLLKTNKELSSKYNKLEKQKEKIEKEYKILIQLISQAQKLSNDDLEQKYNYH